ncbi:Cupin domain-containing protein [Flavobacteriaceae bacterium MAR_2009_75]|nr:Cupin domain-containing protein [Flavobacteriaceae bacterium MAR_2009_75]
MKNLQTFWVLGHEVTQHPTTGDYDLTIIKTPAGVQGPPPHVHQEYKEAFLIVEGEMEFIINGKHETLKAGESLDVPPGTLHTFVNKGDVPCKFVSIHSPKGFFKFFKEFGVDKNEANAFEKSVHPEIIQQVLGTAHQFDMDIAKAPQQS